MAKIISFIGSDSQVGCTMTAASVTLALKTKKYNPLLILASSQLEEGWFSEDYVSGDLGILLRANKITKEDVTSSIVKTGDFDFIRGSRDPLKKQWFDVAILGKLIELVSWEYDYIIIDGGWDMSLPLTQSALFYASRRFYLFNGYEKSLDRFTIAKTMIIDGLGLDSKNDCIILNADPKKAAGSYDITQLKSKTNMEGFTIPKYENPGKYEFDKICPYNRAGMVYTRAINLIAEDIIKAKAGI